MMQVRSDYSLPRAVVRSFATVKTLDQLAHRLDTQVFALEFLARSPHYHEFRVPKKSGGQRMIEDPEEVLKDHLRRLNQVLQCAYFECRSEAAYAFQLATEDPADTRNILTNARRHLHHGWLLNLDFEDFFHQISREEVMAVFLGPPFRFSEEIASLLASLTTYKGRLPMGSPTSPALSNFATLALDRDLLDFARHHQWTYTRFADDLTFSGHEAISDDQLREVKAICAMHHFGINDAKVRLCSPDMTKIVTGLKVSDRVELPDDYLPMVLGEIQKYAHALELNHRTGRDDTPWMRKFAQQVEGHLRFVRYVMGANSPEYQRASHAYRKAGESAQTYDAVSWLDMGYWEMF